MVKLELFRKGDVHFNEAISAGKVITKEQYLSDVAWHSALASR